MEFSSFHSRTFLLLFLSYSSVLQFTGGNMPQYSAGAMNAAHVYVCRFVVTSATTRTHTTVASICTSKLATTLSRCHE